MGGVLGVGEIDTNDDVFAGLDPKGETKMMDDHVVDDFGRALDQSGWSGRVAPRVTETKKTKG